MLPSHGISRIVESFISMSCSAFLKANSVLSCSTARLLVISVGSVVLVILFVCESFVLANGQVFRLPPPAPQSRRDTNCSSLAFTNCQYLNLNCLLSVEGIYEIPIDRPEIHLLISSSRSESPAISKEKLSQQHRQDDVQPHFDGRM